MAAVMGVDNGLRQQVRSLGATDWQTTLTVLQEARVGVIVAVIAGFGGIISEVGAVMLVGGNIEGRTAGDDHRDRAGNAAGRVRSGAGTGRYPARDHVPGQRGHAAPAGEGFYRVNLDLPAVLRRSRT